jgi:hypothetical protein
VREASGCFAQQFFAQTRENEWEGGWRGIHHFLALRQRRENGKGAGAQLSVRQVEEAKGGSAEIGTGTMEVGAGRVTR